ncbi:MAG: hypothetical protein HN350_16985 [Phycisphaerales bacterium]|nr:hypothetical protein [Phycisphaerales bacterium]
MARWITGIVVFCMLAGIAAAQNAIVTVKATPERSVFTSASRDKPIVIQSSAEAAKHFGKDALKMLVAGVDFKKQIVLIFAWRGSGGDRLSYNVAESFPEQIFFSTKRGRTRDLRAHMHVYALRSNVRWRVNGKPGVMPTKPAATGPGAGKLKVTVTPTKPYILPDGKTKIVVKKQSIYLGRKGRTGTLQVMVGDSVMDIVPRTVIDAGGYRYEFNAAPEFKFCHARESDMIFTFVESCSLTVHSSKQPASRIALKKLDKTFELDCYSNMPCRKVHTVAGDGKHFAGFKPTGVSISRFHPSPVLAARLRMNIINNFGAKAIELKYQKLQEVTIGNETITIESFGFDYKARKIKVRIRTAPKTPKAAATILEYAATPKPSKPEPADEFIRVKADGKYADAKLPIAALAKGQKVEVQVKGKMVTGMMAIGGETTGTIIRAQKVVWELDVSGPGLREKTALLSGKTVVVTGIVQQKAAVERGKRTILKVKTMEQGEK